MCNEDGEEGIFSTEIDDEKCFPNEKHHKPNKEIQGMNQINPKT